jgi:hypothetical protein
MTLHRISALRRGLYYFKDILSPTAVVPVLISVCLRSSHLSFNIKQLKIWRITTIHTRWLPERTVTLP